MTAGSMLAPLMMTADRFLIAGMLSVAAVGYYTAPYEVVTKLGLIPGAVSAAVFPAFAGGLAENRTLRALYDSALKATFIALVPPVLVLVAFAHEGLAAWMGPEFAAQGAWVVRWLALGVLVNSVAQIPHALLQSSGRAAAVAKLHALELPAYLIALVLLVRAYGVSGAAFAWAARATVDAAALLHLSRGAASPGAPRAALPGSLGGLLLGVGCLGALLALPTPLPVRTVALALALAAFTAAAWRFTLLPRERAALVQRARRRPPLRIGPVL
jgi:O-antigen/teichoic acid export membrane protein